MKKLIFLFLCLSILSCTKETSKNSSIESAKSDRLVFRDAKEYRETYMFLAKTLSVSDLQLWADERGHSTLLFDPDTLITNNYSPALRTILNQDSEFQMGDSIVWFHLGDFYTYAKNANFVNELKSKTELYRRSGYVTSKAIQSSSKGRIYQNGYSAFVSPSFYQYSYQPCGGTKTWGKGLRKWVTELRDETQFYNYEYWESCLYLIIKLEWKVSSWKEASEQRDVTFTLNGNLTFTGTSPYRVFTQPMNPGLQFTCANGYPASYNLWIIEGGVTDFPMPEVGISWIVNLSGQTTQHVLGDDNNSPFTQLVNW